MSKLLERKEKSLKLKENLRRRKLLIKLQLLRERLLLKELKRERNDKYLKNEIFYYLFKIYFFLILLIIEQTI
jgi:hypothetical protein